MTDKPDSSREAVERKMLRWDEGARRISSFRQREPQNGGAPSTSVWAKRYSEARARIAALTEERNALRSMLASDRTDAVALLESQARIADLAKERDALRVAVLTCRSLVNENGPDMARVKIAVLVARLREDGHLATD
jgi:hypothetical protein